jgi:hypothetical protein
MKRVLFFCIGLCFLPACGGAQAVYDLQGGIRASSTLADPETPGHYIPAKAFDNDPRTIWAEGRSGAGLGETIEIDFGQSIIADEVRIMPGFFNSRWWKPNNRVKVATLFFDEYDMEVTFKDIMKSQSCRLPKSLSFDTFKLRIDAVYAGTRFADTCISEIQFYIDGKQIPIDQNLLKRSLEVTP